MQYGLDFPFFLTDDRVLFEALSPQYDGCLDVGGNIVDYQFRHPYYEGIGEPTFIG